MISVLQSKQFLDNVLPLMNIIAKAIGNDLWLFIWYFVIVIHFCT